MNKDVAGNRAWGGHRRAGARLRAGRPLPVLAQQGQGGLSTQTKKAPGLAPRGLSIVPVDQAATAAIDLAT